MLYALLVAGAIVCAVQAIRSTRLLSAALWLAGVSALVSIILYRMGAQQVAVIELSVGAGLVTVLFVFAISIAGDDAMDARALLPKPLALGLIALFLVVLGVMIFPFKDLGLSIDEPSFASRLWADREMDVLVQIVLIFTGVLCILGLLSDAKSPVQRHAEDQHEAILASGDGHIEPEQIPSEEPVLEEVHV